MNNDLYDKILNILKNKWFLTAIGAIIFFLFLNPLVIIPSGERGLRFTWGAVNNEELEDGLSIRIPIMHKIEGVSIQPQEITFQIEVGQDGAITKDNQSIGVTIIIYYKRQIGKLAHLWSDVGLEVMESIIKQTVKENYKQTAGQYTIFEIAFIQEKIRAKVNELTKANLTLYPIEITELKITNYDWSEAFEKQIEETMQRAQQVKQKEQELLIEEQDAQKKVKRSEANKTSMVLEAEGRKESARLDADAKALEGEGIRKYNESIRLNMAQEIEFRKLKIEQVKAERWNGQYVPTNNYGPIPLQTGGIQPNK